MKFNTFGELVVILPVEDPAAGCVDFLHCLIIIQQALMSVTPPLATCPVSAAERAPGTRETEECAF